jgi:hypothetical protein
VESGSREHASFLPVLLKLMLTEGREEPADSQATIDGHRWSPDSVRVV